MLSIDLFAALEINDNNQINIALAYALMGIGPVVGTLMFIKSAGKMINAASGFMGKVGKWGQKRAMSGAKQHYERGTYATGRATRKAFRDAGAKERAFQNIASGSLMGKVSTLGLRGNTKDRMMAYALKQGDKIYEEDVGNAETWLNKNTENNVDAAVNAFRESAASGSMTKAQAHAHTNHILGMKGGKSSLRKMFKDKDFMTQLHEAGGTDGMVLGALSNSKFTSSHPDIANALNYHRKSFLEDARAGKAHEYLGTNFASGVKTTSGRYVIDKEYKDAAGNVIHKGQGGFQDLQWYIDRPNMINGLSHDFTSEIYDKISYTDAVTAQKDVNAFSNADPGIQGMINEIVARGEPPAGSTRKNLLAPVPPGTKPGDPAAPSWWNTI